MPRTPCCRAATTFAATSARWRRPFSVSSAPSSRSESGAARSSAMPQHFVAPPEWHWYIVWYFFLGGIAGGAYALGTLLRLVGDPQDEGAARTAFLVAFPTFA